MNSFSLLAELDNYDGDSKINENQSKINSNDETKVENIETTTFTKLMCEYCIYHIVYKCSREDCFDIHLDKNNRDDRFLLSSAKRIIQNPMKYIGLNKKDIFSAFIKLREHRMKNVLFQLCPSYISGNCKKDTCQVSNFNFCINDSHNLIIKLHCDFNINFKNKCSFIYTYF